ncbi:MAG: RHS repeat-associated core domain-containing protein, partial [Bacteroidota bacterium]|nr:RHS repeat-associated core domain-containing protein [Bacteroidota bacterium]
MPIGKKIKIYYDPRGQVIRTVNPDLSEQRVVYGVPNNLALVSSSEVENPTPWETYTYDANDLDTESPHYASPKSAVVDALGRTIKTIDRLESSNSESNNVVMKYAYDIRGNLLEVKDAYDNIVFEHVYDLRSPAKEGESIPPLKTTHINKGTSTVVFDCTGKPIETRDAKDALTLHVYDALQRPLAVWCRDNSNENVVMRQHLEYGTSASDNSKGKLWKQYDVAGYQQINTYDFKGNVLEKFRQVIRDSEILNAIATWSAGSWNPPSTCYRVDWGSLGSPNASLLDGVQYQTNMLYDGLNRINEITYPEDASSNRKVLVPTYNKAGALCKVAFDGTEYVKEIAYNAKGQRLLIAYGNDVMTRYVYDENTFRLVRLKTEKYTYSQSSDEHHYAYNSGTTKQDYAYQYDLSGNILSINDETPRSGVGGGNGLERAFEYDALYRLLNATGRENQAGSPFPGWDDSYRSDDPNATTAYSQTYQYDLMGNIAELAHTGSSNFTRSFNYGSNLLNDIIVGGDTYNFYYDTCGNMTRENSERFFEWDYADRLRLYYNQSGGSTEPSVITHYMYDSGGNRVKKLTRVSGGDWESITYIDGLIEYREDSSTNRGSISNIMDDARRVATVRNGHDFGDSTPDVKYNLDNHLGSSGVLLDEHGTLISREEYYPFGETSFGSYSKKRYRFCGKEKDEESGLYYYGARYYSPWICRFISVDPLARKYPFYTAYQYAGNKPIISIDRDGLEETGNSPQQPADTTVQSGSTTPESEKPIPPLPKHGDSKIVNGVTSYYDEYMDKGKGGWSDSKPKSISKTDLDKMKNYYLQNSKNQAAHASNNDIKYDDCITSMNNGMDLILGNSPGTLNDNAKGTKGTSVSETAKYLGKAGNVDSTTKIAMTLKPKMDSNTNQPVTNGIKYEAKMQGSIVDSALKMTGGKDGNYIFALSLLGGYHSMTLTVSIENGNAKYFISDQVFKWTAGWTENPSGRTIDNFAEAFSYSNYPGPTYKNTEVQLW